jgi:hypothetical protein
MIVPYFIVQRSRWRRRRRRREGEERRARGGGGGGGRYRPSCWRCCRWYECQRRANATVSGEREEQSSGSNRSAKSHRVD